MVWLFHLLTKEKQVISTIKQVILTGLPIYRQQPSTIDNNRQQTDNYRQQVFFKSPKIWDIFWCCVYGEGQVPDPTHSFGSAGLLHGAQCCRCRTCSSALLSFFPRAVPRWSGLSPWLWVKALAGPCRNKPTTVTKVGLRRMMIFGTGFYK